MIWPIGKPQTMSCIVQNPESSKGTSAAVSNDPQSGQSKPAVSHDSSQAPDVRRLGPDERRILDALEDDEVREILRANRNSSP
jgi:hypothetical protein